LPDQRHASPQAQCSKPKKKQFHYCGQPYLHHRHCSLGWKIKSPRRAAPQPSRNSANQYHQHQPKEQARQCLPTDPHERRMAGRMAIQSRRIVCTIARTLRATQLRRRIFRILNRLLRVHYCLLWLVFGAVSHGVLGIIVQTSPLWIAIVPRHSAARLDSGALPCFFFWLLLIIP